jgi:CheY-like chemotaxis protein
MAHALKICIIDDEPLVRDAMALALGDLGHDALVAHDGVSGMAIVERERPDVVVTDILMPAGDGMEIIPRLRSTYPAMAIVAMSGGGQNGSSLFLSLARQMGADVCLTKPFQPAELVEAIASACALVRG